MTALIRSWFGILAADVTATVELFLITWLVVVAMLTLATLRLPVAFTVVFVLVALTVLLVLLGTEQASTGLTKTAGYVLLAAAAGVWICSSTHCRWPPAARRCRSAGRSCAADRPQLSRARRG